MALRAVDQPGGDDPAGVALQLVADDRPFAVGTPLDGPASADVRHAHVAAVGRWARVIRALDEDLVTIDRRVHAPAKPDGVVAVPHEGQRELLVGNTLVSCVREDSELLEERDELQVLLLLPDRLEDGARPQRAARRHPDRADAQSGDRAALDEHAVLVRDLLPIEGEGGGGDQESTSDEEEGGEARQPEPPTAGQRITRRWPRLLDESFGERRTHGQIILEERCRLDSPAYGRILRRRSVMSGFACGSGRDSTRSESVCSAAFRFLCIIMGDDVDRAPHDEQRQAGFWRTAVALSCITSRHSLWATVAPTQ